jgi:hypothetical protein
MQEEGQENKFDKAANALLGKYRGEDVLLIADHNHYRPEDVHGFAFKVAENGGKDGRLKGIGLEVIPAGQQRLYDEFFNKQISREEFLTICEGMPHSHAQTPAQKRVYYEPLVNLMEKGVKVIGVGSLTGAPATVETEPAAQEAEALVIGMKIDYLKFRRGHGAEIDKDPKAFLDKYMAEIEGRLPNLSDHQREAYVGFASYLNDEQNRDFFDGSGYKDEIPKLFEDIHSDQERFQKAKGKIVEVEDGGSMTARRAGDPVTAERVRQASDSLGGGLVVLYGAVHSNYAGDIDSALRKNGSSVMIVDIGLGEKDKVVPAHAPDLLREKFSLVQEWIRADIEGDADPNRYRIDNIFDEPERIELQEPTLGSKIQNYFGVGQLSK